MKVWIVGGRPVLVARTVDGPSSEVDCLRRLIVEE